MKIIGKKKAPSRDGMTDLIFEQQEWKRVEINGYKPDPNDEEEVKEHMKNVEYKLATRLALYLNWCIDKRDELPYG